MKVVLFLLSIVLSCAGAENFEGAQIAELYRIRLDRGDLLLETLQDLIQRRGIADGAVLTAGLAAGVHISSREVYGRKA